MSGRGAKAEHMDLSSYSDAGPGHRTLSTPMPRSSTRRLGTVRDYAALAKPHVMSLWTPSHFGRSHSYSSATTRPP
jgi:hypothetical protein